MSENKIELTLPDSKKISVSKGITGEEVAKQISRSLGEKALAIEINGKLSDLTEKISKDSEIKILTWNDEGGKHALRHTAAHILAAAVLRLFPETKPTIGPVIENGFYYDFYREKPFDAADIKRIEEEAAKILKENSSVEKHSVKKEDALKFYRNNKFKKEIIKDLPGKTVSFYKLGEFDDLCKGPHIPRTGLIRSFKITNDSSAYWRGDEKKETLRRLYGVAFQSQKELEDYEKLQEEIVRRDHRRIGEQMELFFFSEEVGPGLPFWLPNGNIIKEELEKWAKEVEEQWGYTRVTTPTITKEGLYYTSGHLPYYADSNFPPMVMDNENYYIKPMNCPHHHMIFKNRRRSYRELPLRLAEYGRCHRYEQSGELHGLLRVRSMDMNDAHIYCTKEQAVDEFKKVIKLHQYYYEKLGIKDYQMELALKDPKNTKKYHGDEKMWKEAETMMREAMSGMGIKIVEDIGGAAFYGPKVDFQIRTVTGKIFSASTNQLDLYMPGRFKLEYIGADNKNHEPVVIHRAPLGTHERFIGFLIEHFAGAFPTWLSPEQVRILPISEKHVKYAKELNDIFRKEGIRSSVDGTESTLQYRVRDAEIKKVAYILVVGDKEEAAKTVTVRKRGGKVEYGKNASKFLEEIKEEIKERKLYSS